MPRPRAPQPLPQPHQRAAGILRPDQAADARRVREPARGRHRRQLPVDMRRPRRAQRVHQQAHWQHHQRVRRLRQARVRRPQLEQFHRRALAGGREVQAVKRRREQPHRERPAGHVPGRLQARIVGPLCQPADWKVPGFHCEVREPDLLVAVGEWLHRRDTSWTGRARHDRYADSWEELVRSADTTGAYELLEASVLGHQQQQVWRGRARHLRQVRELEVPCAARQQLHRRNRRLRRAPATAAGQARPQLQ
uniref:Uncharacterized protein n=1 Tax=Arundo donax TaxID=35708 RepID=A0A0A9HCL9_ARUDO